MGRPRIHVDNAARQAAYRARKRGTPDPTTAEWQAIVDATWDLCDTIRDAARRGNSEAARLNGLKPSQIITALGKRFR
jgi:methylphosphotriester-DNA--protein-cysteine methyltransferase